MPKVSEEYFDKKREEIINAAYRVALNKSISSITLKDVRDEAGMARGGIYRYYNNLDEILAALINKINRDNSYKKDVERILKDKGSASAKPVTVMKKVCGMLSDITTSANPEILLLSVEFDAFSIHEPERVYKISELLKDNDENSGMFLFFSLIDYIKTETKKGTMKPVMPAEDLAEYFMTVVKGILLQYSLTLKQQTEDYNTDSMYNALYRSMIALLGCGK